ncbi:HEAT repeat domain-containing protein [Streptomyces sp. NPDC003016]
MEALLEYGADPDLPASGTEPPLVLAARRGSTETVRALRRHGASARREALEEERRWLGADVEQELRTGLLETFADGGAEPETVTSRIEEGGGVTVVVELLRDGTPVAGTAQQTGHAAIATLLEERLGIRTPFAELAERALSGGDPGRDEWMESVAVLWRRGDEETFLAASEWCASGDLLRQTFAADVLAQLRFEQGGKPFAARALPLLREPAREAQGPELLQAAVLALGHHGDPAALPEILRHAGHPETEVRHRVALSLLGLVPAGHQEGVAALIALSRDPDDEVRDWATLRSPVPGPTPRTSATRWRTGWRTTTPTRRRRRRAARRRAGTPGRSRRRPVCWAARIPRGTRMRRRWRRWSTSRTRRYGADWNARRRATAEKHFPLPGPRPGNGPTGLERRTG